MREEIQRLKDEANDIDRSLFNEVINLDNSMSDCDCDHPVKYDFSNYMQQPTDNINHMYCLNCGGIVLPEKE